MQTALTHFDLQQAAKEIMIEHGFEPDFPPQVQEQLATLQSQVPTAQLDGTTRDLRSLLWSSIDNDTSRDLDQVEVAQQLDDGQVRIMIGIADVDAFVPKGSPIDEHAAEETTTVYTGVRIFPMLPEQLSTGASSLLEGDDKVAFVTEFILDREGNLRSSDTYRALVRNRAQLAYGAVGAWLEGKAPAPEKVAASNELQQQLRLQDQVAQLLRNGRHQHGALDIETTELQPVILNQKIVGVAKQDKNSATELIEDLMIAANGVVARRLRNVPSIRRVVRTPQRWDRIAQLAATYGASLPPQPDSKALNVLLCQQKSADPDHFPDLSLAVIKLMGPGEYVLERPGDPAQGHFGLAVQDYTHSTAPNRRFADIVTQRILKAETSGHPPPYSESELTTIAKNCTLKEDAARKVEREMSKRIAAVAMSDRIGEKFDALVTGVTPHGTFVRALSAHVEGLLTSGEQGLDVGDKITVKLIRTNPQRGYIDFSRV
jgi:VacB/RNase II family 3'-5' exoribonuclease